MQRTSRYRIGAIVALAFTLCLSSSCHHNATLDLNSSESSISPSPKIDAEQITLSVGESKPLTLDNKNIYIDNSNQEVLKSETTEQGILLRGERYGLTIVKLLDATTKKEVKELNVLVRGERPQMPVERFAEFNVAKGGTSFVSDHNSPEQGYFSFDEAKDIRLISQGKTYRTPRILELRNLFPYTDGIDYRRTSLRLDEKETVEIDGKKQKLRLDTYSVGKGIAYALWTGDELGKICLRYQYAPNDQGLYELKITSRYLGKHFAGDLYTIANEGFWVSYTAEDVERVFPTLGMLGLNGEITTRGAQGEYWSSDDNKEDDLAAWVAGFGSSWATQTIHGDKEMKRPLRLIEN